MFDPSKVPTAMLAPVATVIKSLGDVVAIESTDVMLVGAACRDAIHRALGHDFDNRATHDLDLALALRSWATYEEIVAALPKVGGTGVGFRIAGISVDLLRFGDIEDPIGTVEPASHGEPISVWAFQEIHAAAVTVPMNAGSIAIPSVPGYCAAKIGAWLDRSSWGEFKDAADMALIMYWYDQSPVIHDRLYETEQGQRILQKAGFDLAVASASLLGADVAQLIGAERHRELRARWPGDLTTLSRHLATAVSSRTTWPPMDRRDEMIDALTSGLMMV